MFTVDLAKGVSVKVKFHHFTTHPDNPKKRRFNTEATLRIFKGSDFLFEAKETSKCNPVDKPNRNMGKRTALENLMYYIDETGNRKVFEDLDKHLNIFDRKLIWDKFFKTHPLYK